MWFSVLHVAFVPSRLSVKQRVAEGSAGICATFLCCNAHKREGVEEVSVRIQGVKPALRNEKKKTSMGQKLPNNFAIHRHASLV